MMQFQYIFIFSHLHTSTSPSPLPLVLIPSALYLIQQPLCPPVIECVLAAHPRNYSPPPSTAVQHTQHSAQIDVVQLPAGQYFFDWVENMYLFLGGGLTLSEGGRWGGHVSLWKHECQLEENCSCIRLVALTVFSSEMV
ncbi:hypothetical protein INR49_002398 [Caranx melampygus]|nr:hypothetical protein INR49_002398 [Caranx melampygus]